MDAETEIRTDAVRAAEGLRIRELDGRIPLSNDGLIKAENIFRWYQVKNRSDYHAVRAAYGNSSIREPSAYPEIICVETIGEKEYEDDAYEYQMADCRKVTEGFWRELGYRCRIEKL